MKSGIYTRTGDGGTTSLTDGSRSKKNSARLHAYGTVDELSSFLGWGAASTVIPEELRVDITRIQNYLFNIGAYLATPATADRQFPLEGIDDEIAELERRIDRLDEDTPKMRAFILPGGGETASRLHIARTVCRRVERDLITLAENEEVDSRLLSYVNRLSDYLFIAARYANYKEGINETEWRK